MSRHTLEAIVMSLVAQGRIDKEIAPVVGLSERQVKRIVEDVRMGLGAPNRTAAAVLWTRGKRPRPRQRDTLGLTR